VSELTAAAAKTMLEDGLSVGDSEAEYALEHGALCPGCKETVNTVRVIRLLRIRVNFTSTLPRHGRVVICPNCRTILSASVTIA
jgi:hypothetical protein